MATTTTTHPPLLPLVFLAIATATAFAIAIHSQLAHLSPLWTTCSSNNNSNSSPIQIPLCFAISFFCTALETSQAARLEQAAIAAFLASLATITAIESTIATTRQDKPPPNNNDVDNKIAPAPTPRPSSSSHGSNNFSTRVLAANLTLPWLAYNLFLGAFSWQALIVPAFLLLHSRNRSRPQPAELSPADTLAIPLSIAIGLLLPTTLLLSNPASTTLTLLYLLFPLAITLTRRIITAAAQPFLGYRRIPTAAIYAIPILYSATAHFLLLTNNHHNHHHNTAATRAAMLLLEIDHAAIFATFLYWVYAAAGGLDAVCVTLVATVLLGPGAGVGLGWLWRQNKKKQEDDHLEGQEMPVVRPRVRRGKASGHFFGGPLA